METLAFYHIKGGVGKTTAAVNVAYLLASEGLRILLWDLDPQGSATFYFRVRPKLKGNTKSLVKGKVDMDKLVKSTNYDGLDILPADFSNRHMDLVLDGVKRSKKRLAGVVDGFAGDYDLVILDCPPSISLVSENVFKAASLVVVPLIPTVLSLQSFEQLRDYYNKHSLDSRRLAPFFSMVDRRKTLHRETLKLAAEHPKTFMKPTIPYLSIVERMGLERAPLPSFDRRSRAANGYRELTREVANRLGLVVELD